MPVNHANRNYCLDFIKGIACVCVVFMHCEFPGKLGILVQCVSRFCVPFFFIVSGYFSYRKEVLSTEQAKFISYKKIGHIFKITLFSSLFYIAVAIVRNLVAGEPIVVSRSLILYLILFNRPVVIVSQLWFLFALLYVYIIYAFVDRFDLYKAAYKSIPFLIFCYIVLAQGMHLIGIKVPNMIYKNFLIEGFSLFVLGHWLHYKEEKVCSYCKNNRLLIMLTIFTLLCVPERYLLGRDFGVNICTFPQVICLFILGMKNPTLFENNILRKLGTNLSMFVYILHPFVWHTLEDVYAKAGINQNTAALYLMPVFVLMITLILSACLFWMLKIKKNRGNVK